MTQLEKDIERRLVRKVESRGGMCLKWVCPGWSGVPDRVVLLPEGRIVFVELKRPKGGRMSAVQKWWAHKLVGLGFDYELIRSNEDLALFIRLYLQ